MTRSFPAILIILSAFALLAAPSSAQSTAFELEDSGQWNQTQAPEPGSDADIIAQATRHLAEGNPSKANDLLTKWLDKNKRTRNDFIAQAYYLRGVARIDNGREYKALFDFEEVIQEYPSSPYFLKAVEQEFHLGVRYINGLKRRFLGMRFESGRPTGEELLVRTQERVPGSQLAEEAAMTLADHYYNRRELKLAAEMYSIFRQNYPDSDRVRQAMLREIESNIARFKGPRYDGSGLVDAKLLIEQYQNQFPGESIRSGITEGLDAWIDESAAQQVLDTARWYLKVKDETSAKFVLARLVRRHPVTDAADEAISMMIDKGWLILTPATDQNVQSDSNTNSDTQSEEDDS